MRIEPEKHYTTEHYYDEAPVTIRLTPQKPQRAIGFFEALTMFPDVIGALLVTIGMIFGGVDYFAQHGTNAQAFIAACIIGFFIWKTLGKGSK